MSEQTRDQIRAKVFAGENSKVQSRIVTFFGAKIEIRQSTLGDVLEAQQAEDRESAIIRNLVKHAYVPNTDLLVFEEADADTFMGMPFGRDFVEVSEAIEDMTKINFRDKQGKAEETAPGTLGDEAGVGTEEA